VQVPDRSRPLRVLVLSRNYPNNVMPTLGLWVRNVVRELTKFCEVRVVSPVPYCPPLPGLPDNYARFRRIERQTQDRGIRAIHPRMILGPGSTMFSLESWLYLQAIRRSVDALRREFPFDLIHAQFTYPDGIVATSLGRRYAVPVVITEHNSWLPWMNEYSAVRRRSIRAVRQSARVIAVSESVRKTVEHFVGEAHNLTVVPNGVDASEFTLPDRADSRNPHQLLFVGAIRPVKGVDVLLKAMRVLADHGRSERLLIVGEAFYGRYQREELRLKQMVQELGIADRVRFAGRQLPPQLVQTMGRSAALVVPSHIESFGMVLVEALACGTPVIATRSGGPEEIVIDGVGVLVPAGDPEGLARGIEQMLDRRPSYDPEQLRAHALERFGLESVAKRVKEIYEHSVWPHGAGATPAEARANLAAPARVASGRS
jgi:teichuronic acid biosynthesis glycosyltransferase TuaC